MHCTSLVLNTIMPDIYSTVYLYIRKLWRLENLAKLLQTHIEGRKFGKTSHPQPKNYALKLQHNFRAYH